MQVCEHDTHAGIRPAACGRPILGAHEGIADGVPSRLSPQTFERRTEERIAIGHFESVRRRGGGRVRGAECKRIGQGREKHDGTGSRQPQTAHFQRERHRQVAPCRVSCERHCMGRVPRAKQMLVHLDRLVQLSRESALGRQRVVEYVDHCLAVIRQVGCQAPVRKGRSQQVPASVRIHDDTLILSTDALTPADDSHSQPGLELHPLEGAPPVSPAEDPPHNVE